ncbi:MAG: hypothetical protein IJR00_00365 [Lachnospiraceae bacterium]|nr:hypothetical protein [Lachnospiraceae bacterium]
MKHQKIALFALLCLLCPQALSCSGLQPDASATASSAVTADTTAEAASDKTAESAPDNTASATAQSTEDFAPHEVSATVIRDWRRWNEQSYTLSVSPVSKEEAREFTWLVKKDGVLINAPHVNWQSLDPLTSWRKETQSLLLHVRFGLSEDGSDYTLPRDLEEPFEVELVGGPATFAGDFEDEGLTGMEEICHTRLRLQMSEETDTDMQIIPLGEGISFTNEDTGEEGMLTELRIIDGIVWAGFTFPGAELLEGRDFNYRVRSPEEKEQSDDVYMSWIFSLPELTLHYEDGSSEFYGVSNLRPHYTSDGVFLRTTNLPAYKNGSRLVRVETEGESFDIFLSRIRS